MPAWVSEIPLGPQNPIVELGGLVTLLTCMCIGVLRYQWNTGVAGTPKKRWMWDSLQLLREGYSKFYGRPWQVWTSEGYQLVLPPAYLDELKMLPDHTFPSSLREFMLPQYTFKPFAPEKLDYVNHVILHDLNKNMAKVFPLMREEVTLAVPIELPTSTGLHRNEEWIDISCNYTRDLFLSALKLRAVPSFIRPLVAFFLPDLRRVYRHQDRARALVQPILQQRERDEKTTLKNSKANDTIQWIHDLIPEEDKKDYAYQGVAQLAITAVSVQTTSKLIVNVILNLMKYVEYVPVLVEEIESVLKECNGEWTLESMGRLQKLDSFMRESLRFEPPLTGAIAHDPSYYPDPERFDGLRFYRLRQEAEKEGGVAAKVRHQFVATSKTQVQFGLGRHACPGRWFAGHVIKMVVASVLLDYDLKFRDGEERPGTFLFQTTNMPHPKTRILLKRKKKEGQS
ncbi:hypothetical protein Daus18300_004224 [Diaporthe australafricana]|uniref:Cytochrome P450 n=1 Tax=Diaporthe australafricana TaxID=127596 RepID=A0ABR3X9P9_9PEZI